MLECYFPSIELDKFNAFDDLGAYFNSFIFVDIHSLGDHSVILAHEYLNWHYHNNDCRDQDARPAETGNQDSDDTCEGKGSNHRGEENWRFCLYCVEVIR